MSSIKNTLSNAVESFKWERDYIVENIERGEKMLAEQKEALVKLDARIKEHEEELSKHGN